MVRLSQPSLAILPPRYLIFLVYGDRTLYTVEWMAVLYLTWLGLAGAAFNGLKWLNGWCSFQKYSVAAVNVTGVVQCTQVVQLVIMEPRVVLRTEVVIGCILQLYNFVCFGIALVTCRRTQMMMMASSIVAFEYWGQVSCWQWLSLSPHLNSSSACSLCWCVYTWQGWLEAAHAVLQVFTT